VEVSAINGTNHSRQPIEMLEIIHVPQHFVTSRKRQLMPKFIIDSSNKLMHDFIDCSLSYSKELRAYQQTCSLREFEQCECNSDRNKNCFTVLGVLFFTLWMEY
jgi:hypothetical protein